MSTQCRAGAAVSPISLRLILKHWTLQKPFLIPGYADVPESADYFFWKGWYYLIFSNSLTARYRMFTLPTGSVVAAVSGYTRWRIGTRHEDSVLHR